MHHQPINVYDYLSTNNHFDEIYDAMNKNDLSEIVMMVMKVLKKSNSLPPSNTVIKSEQISDGYRNEANIMYKNNDYNSALLTYNKAMLTAPKNSRQLKLAISNRSALFYQLKLYNDCYSDIVKCFEMGCPDDIIVKLQKRKENVINLNLNDDLILKFLHSYVDMLINCYIDSHPLVPCASRHVEFTGSASPKIVAAKDIKPGSVVAWEEAYICSTDYNNTLIACYYCQKYVLHLIPCDNCCYAMFCDNICKNKCYREYHKWECSIMEDIKICCRSPTENLMLKVVLKMRSQCLSWKELIDASYSTGLDRIRTSSIREIYNGNKFFSLLNVRNDKPFAYEIVYKNSFICARLLHYFEQIPSFYPRDSNEKHEAMRALGRIMLFLSTHQTPTPLCQQILAVNPSIDETGYINNVSNFGIFPFTSKLKKSCEPNLLILNINNELILIALRTIKSGEELTISFHEHFQELFLDGNVGDCSICKRHDILKTKGKLTIYQRKYYSDLNFSRIDESLLNPVHACDAYNKLLEALDVLSDVPYSYEYKEVYKRFRIYTRLFETTKSRNFVLCS